MSTKIPSILERIVADTKTLVGSRKRDQPISSFSDFPAFHRAPLSLIDALSGPILSIIAEAKKASPSKGILRTEFDPVSITQAYQSAGAAAVSILTEPTHFQGDIAYLTSCRSHLTIPILRKDFIIDPYQVAEAKAYGADAILLIASILDTSQLAELQACAAEAGLSVQVPSR